MRRVVITGMGMVSPLANDLPTSWSALLSGKSGIASYLNDPKLLNTKPLNLALVKGFEQKKWAVPVTIVFIKACLQQAEWIRCLCNRVSLKNGSTESGQRGQIQSGDLHGGDWFKHDQDLIVRAVIGKEHFSKHQPSQSPPFNIKHSHRGAERKVQNKWSNHFSKYSMCIWSVSCSAGSQVHQIWRNRRILGWRSLRFIQPSINLQLASNPSYDQQIVRQG